MTQASKRAKTLKTSDFVDVLAYVANRSQFPDRDLVVLLLSYKAGLRVGEIAGLRWIDVVDAKGMIRSDAFEVPANIAKKGSGRTVPMHPELFEALGALSVIMWAQIKNQRTALMTNIVLGRGGKVIDPNTLQRYLSRTYERAGFIGCSSHSGRRTFITRLAQTAGEHGCSLRDVQRLAGHRGIETTEGYIDASARVGELVRSL